MLYDIEAHIKRQAFHKCSMCHQRNETVLFRTDPFVAEVYGDKTKDWICVACVEKRAWEI